MTGGEGDAFADALLAARLCAIDPALGGMVLRSGGEVRDAVVAELRSSLPDDAPLRRVPSHIDDERLLGGIDLTATLAKGIAVPRIGVLAEADGGVLVVPMAERLSDATAGRIAAAIDTGVVAVQRDGMALGDPARFVAVALDDGIEADERAPAALAERLAFWIDLSAVRYTGAVPGAKSPATTASGASWMPEHLRRDGRGLDPTLAIEALAATAATLGIDSARASLFAVRAARAAARLAGRSDIIEADVALAARLVLAPRAMQLPTHPDDSPADTAPPPSDSEGGETDRSGSTPLEDVVLAAALASLPKDVLARIAAGGDRRTAIRAHGAGERGKSPTRGWPMSARAGMPGGGRRLSLIDTLRAAAPWQRVRGREDRILVRRDDLRIRRFETRAEAITIFAVDASGSSALARLAEAKGAVELLLAEAYVKRAQVALVAFRGAAADLLLPPTRSLARARRSLADLPGGGGTPLAAGLTAARDLAEAARARGRTPFIVVLTDGRANIALDGRAERRAAQADAEAAAAAIGATGIGTAFIDISPRPRPEGATLAAAMRARYLPLPRADAAAVHAAVSAVQSS